MDSAQPSLEEILLGAVILSPEQFSLVAALVMSSDFASPKCRAVYQAMRQLALEGKPIDELLLFEEIKARGQIDAVGGVSGLSALTDAAATGENAKYYAELVAKASRERRIRAAVAHAQQALANNGDVDEVCGDLRAELNAAGEVGARRLEAKPIYDLAMECLDPDTRREAISTGHKTLDSYHNGGLARGSMTVIGAAPSVGKTQFAINLIHGLRCDGRRARVLFVSMEMDARSLSQRLIALLSEVNNRTIGTFFTFSMSEYVRENYGARFECALSELENLPMRLICGSFSPDDLRALAYRYSGRFDVMIVDYLQRCNGEKGQGARERVEEASRACKDIAVEHGAAVIAIASLNRGGYKDTDSKPDMSHLRESGNIEFDADNIWMLWRAKNTELNAEDLELHIRKQRNGPLATVMYEFDLPVGRITEWPEEKQPNY